VREEQDQDAISYPPVDLVELIEPEQILEPMDPADEEKFNEKKKLSPKTHDPSERDVEVSASGILNVIARMHDPEIRDKREIPEEKKVYEKSSEPERRRELKMEIEDHVNVMDATQD
jgi:hypothetical protein